MQNSMMTFTSSVFDQKYPFWENLFQKLKIVSLSWNLVPCLTQICRIQWWCSLLPFLTGNIFFGLIWSKNSKLFKLKFGTWTNLNMQNSMVMFTFSFFVQRYSFLANLAQKVKVVSVSWNLVLKLIWICRIQWQCFTLCVFLIGNTLSGQIWLQIWYCLCIMNLVLRIIWICRMQWRWAVFPFLTENTPFGRIWSKNSKFSV